MLCYLKYLIFLFLIVNVGSFPCQTPAGQIGECVSLSSCQALYQHSKAQKPQPSVMEYLRKSHCGFKEEPEVCCPTHKDLDFKTNHNENVVNSTLLPDTDTCGVNLENKIVGGENCALDEFPWMALLDYEDEFGRRNFDCGGALINKRYVLTAAHCISKNLVSVRLGEYNILKETDCIGKTCTPPPLNIDVEEKIVFKSYNPEDLVSYHDIALLRLKEEVQYSDYVKPVCLPTVLGEIFDEHLEENVTVSGWGKTEDDLPSSTKRKVEILVRKCGRVNQIPISKGQICAGGQKGKDSCNGDSGGPLMSLQLDEDMDAHWYAIGVLSFGPKPCAQRNLPGIYTQVSKYIYWIVENLKP